MLEFYDMLKCHFVSKKNFLGFLHNFFVLFIYKNKFINAQLKINELNYLRSVVIVFK